ncbi:MAG: helix-turn-helix domain-containing protein [Pseudomonadota bacterium]|nr:helix-turn-helix domain-containing protein [Pseudomonadota bacterium]
MKLLTTTEAAVALKLSPSQTRRLAAAGRIPGAELRGRDWWYRQPLKILPPDRPKGWPRKEVSR